VKDLKAPAGVTILNDEDEVVVALEEVRVEEEAPAAEAATEEAAEPEAIKQKGAETEEGGEEKKE
jgi:hypothetical protein